MQDLDLDFDTTFRALETGLQVRHIAEFRMFACAVGQTCGEVLGDPRGDGLDHIPVADQNGIVGVLERFGGRTATPETPVEHAMAPLNGSMLVADGQPVADVLEELAQFPYRLVVRGGGVAGIVTPSDLLKLPVRLYAFMLVTHLEMLMAAFIRVRAGAGQDAGWMTRLSEGRQKRVRDKHEELLRQRRDPDLLELTDLSDKRTILLAYRETGKRALERDLKEIETLRNSIAHAATFVDDGADLGAFVRRVRLARNLIHDLRRGPAGRDPQPLPEG